MPCLESPSFSPSPLAVSTAPFCTVPLDRWQANAARCAENQSTTSIKRKTFTPRPSDCLPVPLDWAVSVIITKKLASCVFSNSNPVLPRRAPELPQLLYLYTPLPQLCTLLPARISLVSLLSAGSSHVLVFQQVPPVHRVHVLQRPRRQCVRWLRHH